MGITITHRPKSTLPSPQGWQTETPLPRDAQRFAQALQGDESAKPASYTVRAGDNLSRIAARHGMSLDALIKANPQIRNPNLIYPGQQLHLPPAQNEKTIDPSRMSAQAIAAGAASAAAANEPATSAEELIYSDRVSPAFAQKVIDICQRLQMDPNHLMAIMHFETGGTFDPAIRNPLSKATGLIQFLRSTAYALETSIDALAGMDAERQLDFVEAYLQDYAGRMNSVEDAYMAVFYPKAMGRGSDYVLFSQGSRAYAQNAALDGNVDGHITKAEAAAHVQRRLQAGLDGRERS